MAELFDELNKAVSKVQEGAKAFLDKTDIDEKIVDAAKDLKNKAQEALDKTDLDEKLVGALKDIKGKAQETFEKARPGVEEAFNKVGAEAKALFDRGVEAVKGNPAGDAMDEIKKDVAEQVESIRAAAKGTDPIHDFFNPKSEAADQAKENAATDPEVSAEEKDSEALE